MWLSLLFAAFDDAALTASRKAARHEMKQRLFPMDRNQRPSAAETFFEFFEKLTLRPVAPLVNLTKSEATALVNNFVELVWMDAIGGPGCPHFLRSVIEATYRSKLNPSGSTIPDPRFSIERTEFDPLFRIALWTIGEEGEWDFYTVAQLIDPESFPNTVLSIYDALPSARDWVQMTHPDLTGMTWTQIVTASDHWHDTLQGVGFRGPVPTAFVVAAWPDGWTLQRLTEKKDFADEGTSMAHCIGGPIRARGIRDGESQYWQAARDGEAAYFSLRNQNGVPEVTMEVLMLSSAPIIGQIGQVQGPNDDPPNRNALPRLSEVITALGGWFDQRSRIRWDSTRLPLAPFLGEEEVEKTGIRSWLGLKVDALSIALEDGHGRKTWSEATYRLLAAFVEIQSRKNGGYSSGICATSFDPGPTRHLLTKASGLPYVLGYAIGSQKGRADMFAIGVGADQKRGVWLFVWKPNNHPQTSVPWVEGKSGDLRKTQDPIEALRWFLDVPATPPDTSHITLFPGLKPDPTRTAWRRALEPIALARKERALQADQIDLTPSSARIESDKPPEEPEVIQEDEFIDRFDPEPDEEGNLYVIRDPESTADAIAIRDARTEGREWTVVETDEDPGSAILSGTHHVNRIGIILTRVPHNGRDIEVRMD